MKKVFFILGTLLLSLSTYAAMNVNKIDPPFWYTGMQNPELQLMVYGEGIGNAAVSVNYPGVSLSSTVKLESNNYLLVYLKLDKDVKPGKMTLTFTQGKKKLVKEYELKARAKKGCEHKECPSWRRPRGYRTAPRLFFRFGRDRLVVYSGIGKQHDRRFLPRLCHHRLLQGRPPLRHQRRI